MLYKTNDIAVGRPIEINIGSNTVEYEVCGFFNSVMSGSHNCTLTLMVLSDDKYAELESAGHAYKCTLCSVRLKNGAKNLDYQAYLKNAISERFPDVKTVSNSYDIVSKARYISQGICSSIVSVAAFLVLLIALVVTVSDIINYIRVNMKDLGAHAARRGIGSGKISGLTRNFYKTYAVSAQMCAIVIPCCRALGNIRSGQTHHPCEKFNIPLAIVAAE